MDYSNIYNSIIDNAISRNWTKKSAPVYVENHHIIPRCVGGLDNKSNLILLTAKEHYISHVLLTSIYKNTPYNGILCEAVRMMKNGNGRNFTGSMYEKLRIRAAESHSKRISGKNHPLFKGQYITPRGTFESALQASKECNITDMTVSRRCKSNSKRWKDWSFKNIDGTIEGIPTDDDYYSGQNNSQSVGIWSTPFGDFQSLKEAGKTLECDPYTVRYRVYSDSDKWNAWFLKS